MTKYKAAVLDDNPILLKETCELVDKTNKVSIVFSSESPLHFIQNVMEYSPDFLILDIELGAGGIKGIDVSNKLKIPTLFVSGFIRDCFLNIEELNFSYDFPVDHVSRPITEQKICRAIHKFIISIESYRKKNDTFLLFKNKYKEERIDLDTIVFLATDKEHGAASNNKVVYFTNRKPEILVDFSFSKMASRGLTEDKFMQIRGSHYVNKNRITEYNKKEHTVRVNVMDFDRNIVSKDLDVSENYRPMVLKHIR